MSRNKAGPTFTRRELLKASLSVGAMAASPLLLPLPGLSPTASSSSGTPASPLRVGLMLPPSRQYAELGKNLQAGMELAFKQSSAGGKAVAIVAETIGYSVANTAAKASKLLKEDRIDVGVALVNERSATQLHKVFHPLETPLIVCNVGANISDEDGPREYLHYNTLHYWQASRAIGNWAARHLGTRGAMLMSFYESGYDTPYAFQLGFEAAGGMLVQSTVSHRPTDSDDFGPLLASVRAANPDFVYALYSGSQAVQFVQAYAEAGLAGRIPLVGSAYLVDESLLSVQGRAAEGIYSAFSWSPSLVSSANQTFTHAYREAAGRGADSFALLGYDTAHLLQEIVRGFGSGAALYQVLGGTRASRPLYLRKVQRVGGVLQNVVVSELDAVAGLDETLRASRSELTSGWLNPYLAF